MAPTDRLGSVDHSHPAPEGSRAGPLPELPESVAVPALVAEAAERASRGGGPVAMLRIDVAPLRRSREFRLLFIGQGVSFFGSMVTYVARPYQAYRISHSSLIVGTAQPGGAHTTAHHGIRRGSARRRSRPTADGSSYRGCDVPGDRCPGREFPLTPPAPLGALRGCFRRRRHQSLAAALAWRNGAQVGLVRGAPAGRRYLVAQGHSRDGGGPPVAGVLIVAVGLRYARSRQDLIGSYLIDMKARLFGIPTALFPQVASHFGGAAVLGVLYATPSAGSLLVTLTSGWARRVRRHGRMVALSAATWGFGIIGFGFARSLPLAIAGFAAAGGADMVTGLCRTTMWNESIPDLLRGRLAGIEILTCSSGTTLGDVEAGVVESLAGLRVSIVSGGVLCVVGTVALATVLPRFWNYDSTKGARLRSGQAD